MTLTLGQFRLAMASAQTGQQLRFTPDSDRGQVEAHTPSGQPIQHSGLAHRLSDEERENIALKRAFVAALQKEYDAYHVLHAIAHIKPLDPSTPLSIDDARNAVAQSGDDHKLLSAQDLQTCLRDMCPEVEDPMSWLDQAIERHDPTRETIIDRSELSTRIEESVRSLRTPCSPYLARCAADRAVEHYMAELASPDEARAQQPDIPVRGLVYYQPPEKRQVSGDLATGGNPPDELPRFGKMLSGLNSARWFNCNASSYFHSVQYPKVQQGTEDWHLNCAVLAEFARRPHMPPQMAAALAQRAVGYLYKFAIGSVMPDGWQLSAAQTTSLTYYRGMYGPQLYHEFQRGVLGGRQPEQYLFPVSSHQALDALKRLCGLADLDRHLAPLDAHSAPEILDRIARAALQDLDGFFMDINPRLAGIEDPEDLDPQALRARMGEIVQQLMDELQDQVRAYVDTAHAGLQDDERDRLADSMMDVVKSRTMLGGTLQLRDQPVVFVSAPPGSRETTLLREFLPRSVLAHGGHGAGPSQVQENWSGLASTADILKAMGVADVDKKVLLPRTSWSLQRFDTYDAFLAERTFARLAQAIGDAGAPDAHTRSQAPAVAVLGKVTMQMLEGIQDAFDKPGLGKRMLDDACLDPVTGPVFQYLYNRILGHLQDALEHTGSLGAFTNHIQLAHEEISTLLAILQPHDPAALDLGLPKAGGIEPVYGFRNSGMNAFSTILSGVEALKGSRALNVVSLAGTYYEETLGVLAHAAHYQASTLEGEDVGGSIDRIRQQLGPEGRVDLYVAEFHHNISTEKNQYAQEEVAQQIRALLDADPRVAAERLTVAIDTTIALGRAPEIEALLETFKREISDGKLNLVLFRSGQKFDMAGLDNYNAGFMASYNEAGAFARFRAGSHVDVPTATANIQGMLHMQTYCGASLDEYRKTIMDGHARLLGQKDSPAKLPDRLVSAAVNGGNDVLLIAPNSDANAVFLDLRSPLGLSDPEATEEDNGFYTALMGRMKHLLSVSGLAYGDRPSFGFPHVNISTIGGTKLRITLGLESEAELGRIRDCLVLVEKLGSQARDVLGAGHGGLHRAMQGMMAGDPHRDHASDRLFQVGLQLLPHGLLDMQWSRSGTDLSVQLDGPVTDDLANAYIALARSWHAAGGVDGAFHEAGLALLDALAQDERLSSGTREQIVQARQAL